MTWIKENWFRIAILVILLIFAWPFYYYYVLYLPEQEAKKIANEEAARIREENRRSSIDRERNLCLRETEFAYVANWADQCKNFGLNNKGKDCTLPGRNADRVEQWRKDAKDECFKKYPVQ